MKEAPAMNPTLVDRDTFLKNLRKSKLLTNQQFRLAIDKLGDLQDGREIAKALASWKLLTKFQARMLLAGGTTGFFIGSYRILEQIGQGGMGRVYKAMHRTMNRVVALKVLAPQVVGSARAQELFLREVQAAAQLSHPNIVMAFDANEQDGRHYLAMEFVEGPNLERYVTKHGSLPVGRACEIIFQTANGLQYAFEKGMIHRDIKPANLLLHREPGAGTIQVKILDFGLARLHHPSQADGSESILMKQNTVMGTPDFLSPEQSRNLHETDIRSDLYSLGCTFYYLLTGRVPFPGGSTMDKLIRQNGELVQPIEEVRPDVPVPIRAIVHKLLAKNPDDRFQTPDELMDALAPYAAPSAMDWPIAPPSAQAVEKDSDVHEVLEESLQEDTEPRAQDATRITDADSVLDWVDTNRRYRRRRYLTVALTLAMIAAGVAGLLMWTLAP
jgi:serine/threonine-protein kinase